MLKLSSFRRVTSNNKFIPELDGLRFIAIFSVMLYHTGNRLEGVLPNYSNLFTDFLHSGYIGVEIFFAISGYILAFQILKNPNFSYSEYIRRRLLRIEPTFVIATFLIFFMWFFIGKVDRGELLKSLVSVVTYTSNFTENNIINAVTWSLEIEIQFYLLLPFFLLIYGRNKWLFFGVMLIITCLGMFSSAWNWIPIKILVNHFQWFGVGIIIAVLQIKNVKINTYFIGLNALLLFGIFYIARDEYLDLFDTSVILVMLLVLFNNVLILKKGIRFLSLPIITTIGGMCYTVYLFHYPIMNILFGKIINPIKWNSDYSNEIYISVMLIVTIVELVISFMLFKIVEKPFMYKDWPNRFAKILNKVFGSKNTVDLN